MLTRRQLAWVGLSALLGCSEEETGEPGQADPPTGDEAGTAVAGEDGFVLPPPRHLDPNPLGLPPVAPVPMKKGQRVFTAPPRMVRSAKLGSAFVMASATFVGQEGSDYIVRVGYGEPYQIHPGYVVVPRRDRFRRGAIVVAAYRDRLHHGVVTGLRRDRVLVQYTDLGFRLREQRLDPSRIGVLDGGLQPGSYAAYRAEQEYRHVLLVSKGSYPDGKTLWLALEHEGEIRLIEESQLVALPRPRFKPKEDTSVLAAWRGSMVRAHVRDFERPGLYTVKRPRAGAPLLVGPGMLMPAP